MKELHIDIETFSSADLSRTGVYRYAESEDFEILLFGYSVDGGDVRVVDLTAGEAIPPEIIDALTDPTVTKYAHNCAFERVCLSRWMILNGYPLHNEGYSVPEDHVRSYLDPESWRCTMVWSAYLGLPMSLAGVGSVLGLEKQKLQEGKDLVRYFCIPCSPKESNGNRTRNRPTDASDKWERFVKYNVRDVETEMEIQKRLSGYPVPDEVWDQYHLDQQINDRGILLDMTLVENAIKMDARSHDELTSMMQELTQLDNPGSVQQMKRWLAENGMEVESLGKKQVAELLKDAPKPLGDVLMLRQQLAKSSVRKYQAMDACVCADGRARGMFQFYGANRTGRWCLTGDHEVLTPDGWVRLDEWYGGQIACWQPSGEVISFSEAESVSFPYEGHMYHYHDARIDQISTPDHKMYARKNRCHDWCDMTVEQMAGSRPLIPLYGYRVVNKNVRANQFRVLIMTQADGHYTDDGQIRYHFKKARKVERCKSLLRKCEIMFISRYNEKSDTTTITISSRAVPLWLRQFKDKVFRSWMLDENADVFFDELPHWDGYRPAANSIQYCTSIKQNADFVQAFAHLSGRTAVCKMRRRIKNHKAHWKDAYVVDIWENATNAHEIRPKPTVEMMNGTVYCAVTKSGYFLVRRNGKVWVTGNSGKLIQLQNVPQNHLPDLEAARDLVCAGDYEGVNMLFGSVPDVLSELIRTALVAPTGKLFYVADFSAIEARVIAWLAGEQWRQDLFASGGDIYCQSASQMFGVPVEKHGVNGHLRQKGKIAELACGYGGSVGALKAMGALEMGLREDELLPLVTAWRKSNPSIVKLWWDVDDAAMRAVMDKTSTETHGLRFTYKSGMLFVTLPSGRQLSYVKPAIGTNQFGSPSLTYLGVGVNKRWERLETYGPKLVENCLAEGTLVLTDHGLKAIETVDLSDLIWDGEEWVRHDGVIDQGFKTTIKVDGLRMTPDHKILTEKGWMRCAQSQGHHWANVRVPDRCSPGEQHTGRKSEMDLPMCVREHERNAGAFGLPRGQLWSKIMRLHEKCPDCTEENDSWHEPSSGVCCVAVDETEMRKHTSSRIQKLRRAWHHCMCAVVGKLSILLGGYERFVLSGFGIRSHRQQQGILKRELSLGDAKNQRSEQAHQPLYRNPVWKNDDSGLGRAQRHWCNNDSVSVRSQLADRIVVHQTELQEHVLDIRNCGPRHRFAVYDPEQRQLRIVSNCIQGLSRDILCYAMNTLRHCFICGHVHDELIIEAAPDVSLEEICEQMGRTPPWADGLLLRADGYVTPFYKKD